MGNWFDRLAIRLSQTASRRRFLVKGGGGLVGGLLALFTAGSSGSAQQRNLRERVVLNNRPVPVLPITPIERPPIQLNNVRVIVPRSPVRTEPLLPDPPRFGDLPERGWDLNGVRGIRGRVEPPS